MLRWVSQRGDRARGALAPGQRADHGGLTVATQRDTGEQGEDRPEHRLGSAGVGWPTLTARSSECTTISMTRVSRKSSKDSDQFHPGIVTAGGRRRGRRARATSSRSTRARWTGATNGRDPRGSVLGVLADPHVALVVQGGPEPRDPVVVLQQRHRALGVTVAPSSPRRAPPTAGSRDGRTGRRPTSRAARWGETSWTTATSTRASGSTTTRPRPAGHRRPAGRSCHQWGRPSSSRPKANR